MITEYTLEIALEKFLFPKQVARNSALSGEPGIIERKQRRLFGFRVKINLQMKTSNANHHTLCCDRIVIQNALKTIYAVVKTADTKPSCYSQFWHLS